MVDFKILNTSQEGSNFNVMFLVSSFPEHLTMLKLGISEQIFIHFHPCWINIVDPFTSTLIHFLPSTFIQVYDKPFICYQVGSLVRPDLEAKWNVLKNHESVSLRVSQWQRFFFRNAWTSTNVVIIILSWGCGSIETGNVFHFAFVGHPSGNLLYNGVSLLWNIWTIFSRPQHFFPISPHNTRYQLNLINEFSVTLELKFIARIEVHLLKCQWRSRAVREAKVTKPMNFRNWKRRLQFSLHRLRRWQFTLHNITERTFICRMPGVGIEHWKTTGLLGGGGGPTAFK